MTTVLNLKPIMTLTREQFVQLCQANPDLQLERSLNGELIIVAPIGGKGGTHSSEYTRRTTILCWIKPSSVVPSASCIKASSPPQH